MTEIVIVIEIVTVIATEEATVGPVDLLLHFLLAIEPVLRQSIASRRGHPSLLGRSLPRIGRVRKIGSRHNDVVTARLLIVPLAPNMEEMMSSLGA